VELVSVKVDEVNVSGFMAVLKVALTAWLSGTLVAVSRGEVRVMYGPEGAAVVPTVKLQESGRPPVDVSALPERSVAAFVIVAVYIPAARAVPVGVKVSVFATPEYVTRPPTAAAGVPVVSVKVAGLVAVIVLAFMGLLKVAVTIWLVGTPVAPLTGFSPFTVGFVVSGAAAVVNVQLYWLARA
jgi:hypothetical protein